VFDPIALRARLAGVRERIARAADRAGRDPAAVRLVAVSKTFSSDHVRAAAEAGQLDFGENKVQEALAKIEQTADLGLRWHLIGHLQSNKAKKAAAAFHAIHSVDGESLLRRIEDAALGAFREIDVLVQVDLAHEPTKHGATLDQLDQVIASARTCRAAHLKGLMILPPAAADPEEARPYFRRLRELRDELVARGGEPSMLSELSMGMSHDYEAAIEEGATMVRVGSAIFGERTYV
jgi:pyridoxal phosphate enzyme (YggS family)